MDKSTFLKEVDSTTSKIEIIATAIITTIACIVVCIRLFVSIFSNKSE